MHETITLQLGQRSNYIATHFWNTQESYFTYSAEQESLVDHDVHFRPGLGADGTETFTPRTLIYDLKGGFGALKKINALYEIDEPAISHGLWNGPALIQRQEVIEANPYQKSLEEGLVPPPLTTDSVRYWSDFNRVFFHPKSIVQLNEYDLNSALMPFEHWNLGEELFHSLDKEHDLLDRDLRAFAEEADHMQGIQIMSSVDDAWGGFAARYMDRIRDEYGKTSVCFWGVEDSIKFIPRVQHLLQTTALLVRAHVSQEKRFIRLSNSARSVSEISSQASLYVPMTVPSAVLPNYVSIDMQSQWHGSALLSTALESMTLPSRLKASGRSRETMDQLVNSLNINGNQNIAKLRMSIDQTEALNDHHRSGSIDEVRAQDSDARMPSQDRISEALRNAADEDLSTFDIDIFPSESEQLRGRRSTKKTHVFGQAETHRASEAATINEGTNEDEGFERARRRAAGLPIIQRSRIALPFPLLDSFPHIFAQPSSSSAIGVKTSLTTDTTVAARVKELQLIVNRAISMDEREALSNSLGEIAEGYEEGWSSGSDEDDDD